MGGAETVRASLATFGADRRDLHARVVAARQAWSGLDADDGLVAADLARLDRRLATGTVAIGVFGLINRGKSTLVNALLGVDVSPTGATPETAVPVTIRHGLHSRGTVRLADGSLHTVAPEEVRQWVSQEHNPGNRLGVAHLDWQVDADLLAPGVTLLDTPGLDDVDETYTDRTLQQLERVDAGLVVVSSPPTVGGQEMAHLQALHASHGDRLVVACNIHELHMDDPEVVEAVLGYVRQHVERVCPEAAVVPVCATRAGRAQVHGDTAAWEASGGAALRREVEAVAATMAGERLVGAALADLEAIVGTAERQARCWTSDTAPPTGARPDPWTHAAGVLAQVEDARLQAHLSVRRLFDDARNHLSGVHDRGRLQERIDRFVREVDTCLHDAQARVADRLARLAADLDIEIDSQGEPVGFEDLDVGDDGGGHSRLAGLAGGVGLAAAGLVLGPLGLVGGAVIGWRLGDLATSEVAVTTTRRRVVERLREIRDDVLADLDAQMQRRVELTRSAAREREQIARRDANRRRAEADRVEDVIARMWTAVSGTVVPDDDPVDAPARASADGAVALTLPRPVPAAT